jgi:hypothetical protein
MQLLIVSTALRCSTGFPLVIFLSRT